MISVKTYLSSATPLWREKVGLIFCTMKKDYCEKCGHLKYVDAEGYGYCELWEEADVSSKDEACVEFEESEINELDYE